MLGSPQDAVLSHCVLDLALLNDDLLLQYLDGVQLGSQLLAAQNDLAVGSAAKNF